MAIDMKRQLLDGVPITTWVVWWRTHLGLHRNMDEALKAAELTELPVELIKAVPVALTADGSYEERP